jgi:hypothetical protein
LVPPPQQQPQQQQQQGGGDEKPGWISRNQDWLMPLLTGIGTMASSPSRYLGSAILQGIGGAAGAYENVQSQMQERAAQAAKTTAQQQANRRASSFYMPGTSEGYMTEVYDNVDRRNKLIPTSDFLAHQERYTRSGEGGGAAVGSAPGSATAQPGSGQPIDTTPRPATPVPLSGVNVGGNTDAYADEDRRTAMSAPPGMTEKYQADSVNKIHAIGDAADMSRAARPTLVPLLQSLTAPPNDVNWAQRVLNAPGAQSETRSAILKTVNTYAKAILPDFEGFGDADTLQDISRKLNAINGSDRARLGDQRSLGALNELMAAFPNRQMTPQAAAEIAGTFASGNQRALDKQQYAPHYGPGPIRIYGNNFERAFEERNPQSQYNAEATAIKRALLDPEMKKAWDLIQSGKGTQKQIDRLFRDRYGVDNMGRYFNPGG